MQTTTVIYIVIAFLIALTLAYYQYRYKTKSRSNKDLLFAFLRFVSLFTVTLLIINPKLEQNTFITEKPNLVVAVDNSNSVEYLGQSANVESLVEALKTNKDLEEKFNIRWHAFGNELEDYDSLNFTDKQSNISKAFTQLGQIYNNNSSPTILLSDGNQTLGNDYQFSYLDYKQPVYPVILGDTVTYTDLKIDQLNVNKYAYLKNKFPVEAIVVYSGNETVNTKFEVTLGQSVVYSKPITLSKETNSQIINFTLPANQVGVRTYKAVVVSVNTEKNTVNNVKNFAVEVIDQKTEVAIVTTMVHPDLGAIKKSIETNEQRSVSFVSPKEFVDRFRDFQMVVLYQPNRSFTEVVSLLDSENLNRFVVTGTKTDWNFINSVSGAYSHIQTRQNEDYQAILNSNYTTFIVDDLGFESFPPIQSDFGEVTFNVPHQSLLYKKVGRITTEEPLLATMEISRRREAILLGEGIWRWRAQSYLNTNSFEEFDDFMGKLVQYLSSDTRKSRLNIDYQSFYDGSDNVVVKAQYFNKNYEFDIREPIEITVQNKETKAERTFPFILRHNNYQVDLSTLPAGDYTFTVSAMKSNISKSGQFTILEFNVEQQFLNADVTKLQNLATNSKGSSYFIADYNSLFDDLLNDDRYVAVQKKQSKIVPLIDFKYLLAIIALSLAFEWFLRKYNGLI